jgi:hypothetical protein
MPYPVAGPVAFAAGFGLRACALRFGWSLPPPPYGPKPMRTVNHSIPSMGLMTSENFLKMISDS